MGCIYDSCTTVAFQGDEKLIGFSVKSGTDPGRIREALC